MVGVCAIRERVRVFNQHVDWDVTDKKHDNVSYALKTISEDPQVTIGKMIVRVKRVYLLCQP